MAKNKKRHSKGGVSPSDSVATKEFGRLLEEIIQESLNPECNLIVLDGKIRELEDVGGQHYVSLLGKKINHLKTAHQRVVLDLLGRNKSKTVMEQLQKVAAHDSLSIKVRLLALTQLQEWDVPVDEETVLSLRAGKDVINAVERYATLGADLEAGSGGSINERYRELPRDLRVAVIREILDDYPEQKSLVLDLIQDESDIDEKIVTLLSEQETQEVADLFGRLLAEGEDKAIKRLLKRHVYRLKQKGFSVDIPKAEPLEGPKIRSIEAPEPEAYVSGIDYLGERLLFLGKSVVGWGAVFFQIALSDQDGLKTFNVFDLKRKEIKNFLKRVDETGTLQLISIPPDYCHYLLEEAYQISLQKRRPLPEQYGQWRAELNQLKGTMTEPLIYSVIDREQLQGDDYRSRRLSYGSLLNADGFKDWFLEPRLLWKHIEKYKEVENSPLVLNKFQKEDRKSVILAEAAQDIFDEQYRLIFKRRIEEMAYIFYRNGDEDTATLALMVAMDLGNNEVDSDRNENEFIRALIAKSIDFYVEGERESRQDNMLIQG